MKPLNITIVYADDGSVIDSDDACKYESFYCDRCLNKPTEDPPACPAYELLIFYGCVAGQAKEKSVQDILRLFFPPHPTAKGKLDQCRMFVEKKFCKDCQHWKPWDRGSDKHYCDRVEEQAKGIEDFFLPVLFTNGDHPIYTDDPADCWLYTPEEFGCPNWEERSDNG